MSVTLRDAQHLCWKTFKKLEQLDHTNSATFEKAKYLQNKADELAQKIGELTSSDGQTKDVLSKLISELLFATFVTAEMQGIDLEESFLQTVNEIILGFVA